MAHENGNESKEGDLRLTLERMQSQNKGKMSQYHKELLEWTKNVDKRYAWVVLAALFFMMCATLGPYRVYGLIYAKVTTEGIYNREDATWPVSTIFTVENIAGPFVSIIAYHISYRQSMFIGGLLLALGNGLATFSTTLMLDVILIGFVQGIGYSFIFMPFMEIINSYFLKYRSIALGASLCGGTLAIALLQPLFKWMLIAYPWRYSYLGIGLVCCINLLMVPLLKPNPKPKQLKNQQQQNMAKGTLARLSMRALTYQNSVRNQSTILISRKGDGVQRQASILSVNPFASSAGLERKISRSIREAKLDQQQQQQQEITSSVESEVGVESGAQSNQPYLQTQSCISPPITTIAGERKTQSFNLSNRLSPNVLAKRESADQYESLSLSEVGSESEFEFSLVWEVLKTPGFHMIWYNELIYFWVFSIYCLVMVDYGIDRGCTKDEADSLITYQSIGELIGRLVLTVFVDMQFTSNKNIVILLLITMSTLLVLITNVTGIIWLASITVAISALLSLLYILLNGLLVDYLGERKVTLGYGMASCFGGILMSFRPQAVGYFRDIPNGTYDPLMICLAIACAIGALSWIIEPIITSVVSKKKADTNCDSSMADLEANA